MISSPVLFGIVKTPLRGGDLAQIDFAGELLLVRILNAIGDSYLGHIMHRPRLTAEHGLIAGDRISFGRDCVGLASRNGHWLV